MLRFIVRDPSFVTKPKSVMDMSLLVVERLYGIKRAEHIANMIKHERLRDSDSDPFAEIHAPKSSQKK